MTTITDNTDERQAENRDAKQRLRELWRVRKALLPDASDPLVAGELATIESKIHAALTVLRETENDPDQTSHAREVSPTSDAGEPPFSQHTASR